MPRSKRYHNESTAPPNPNPMDADGLADEPDDLLEEEGPSKSARKRDALKLRDLGRTLTRLEPTQLAALPLSEPVREAVLAHQRIRSNGASKRQLLYLGGLLRQIDAAPIINALDDLAGQSRAARAALHDLERWREALLADSEALTRYVDEHPHTDRQQLRTLITRARKAAPESPTGKAATRALFRFLRDNQPA